MSETGSVKLGMIVAVKLRRNTKMTRDDEDERDAAASASRRGPIRGSRSDRSILTSSGTDGGSCARSRRQQLP